MWNVLLPLILSFARHGLTALAGILVAKGVLGSGNEGHFVDIVLGAISYIAGQGASLIKVAKTAKPKA